MACRPQKQMADFMRDGATEERPRVHAGSGREQLNAVDVHGGECAAPAL